MVIDSKVPSFIVLLPNVLQRAITTPTCCQSNITCCLKIQYHSFSIIVIISTFFFSSCHGQLSKTIITTMNSPCIILRTFHASSSRFGYGIAYTLLSLEKYVFHFIVEVDATEVPCSMVGNTGPKSDE